MRLLGYFKAFFVEPFYNPKTDLRGKKYISKQKKTAFLFAQKTPKKKKVHKQTKKTAFLYA